MYSIPKRKIKYGQQFQNANSFINFHFLDVVTIWKEKS
jgi:hypothetical protein